MRRFFFLFLLFSLPLIPVTGSAENQLTKAIEFMAPATAGDGIPAGWELKQWAGKPVVSLERENGATRVRMFSDKSSFGIGREVNLRPAEFPYVQWRWKVTRLPEGADVRLKGANDQAAQLYLVFPKFPATVNSRAIGYIWDSTAPEGTRLDSSSSANIKYIVIRSGKGQLGKWISESRNVYQDYKTLFGEEPPAIEKVFIMIDSDNTKTVAESFFDSILFQKRAVAEAP